MNFYKRWNISLNGEEEFKKFKNRLLAAIDTGAGRYILEHPSISMKFALQVGHKQPIQSVTGMKRIAREYGGITGGAFGESFDETEVYLGIVSAPDEKSLIFALQCLFRRLEEQECTTLENLVKAVREVIDASPLINIRVAKRGHRVTLYPEGAKVLDEIVVNDTLEWLSNHPTAAKHFENALEICLKKDTARYRNLLDELRSALEKLVRNILDNKKSLENQKEGLLQWLDKKGIHVQVRNLFANLLGYFTKYQNDAVKHGEDWAVPEIEYMIYLTGTFMRLLLQLNGENK
jgi:hypothetical protein